MASKLIKANATYLNIDFFAADQFFLIYNVKSSIRPNVIGRVVIVVDTKIAKSGDLGAWVNCKHKK